MRRGVIILIVLMAIMLGGGVFTAGLFGDPPTLIQSTDPNASVFEATPEQALQFTFWIIFVLVNLIGAGATLAILMWRGNIEVKKANAMPNASELRDTDDSTALPEAEKAKA